MKLLFDILGILGLIQILLAFFLLQRRKLTDDSHIYNVLNIVGGICLGTYGIYYKVWFSVVLNFVWAVVAVWDLIKNLRNSRSRSM
jgi:hypothetical protein